MAQETLKRVSIKRVEPRLLGPKDWGNEVLLVETPHYTLKRLEMKAGYGGPLQYHEVKEETFTLHEGEAFVDFDPDGYPHDTSLSEEYLGQMPPRRLERVKMVRGETFHVPPGAVHRVIAISDCVFYEASLPVFDDRVGVSELYPDADSL